MLFEFRSFSKLSKDLKIKMVNEIEKSILNSSIDKATQRNIKTYWESDEFVEQYSIIGNLVKTNLDPNSSINKNKDPKVRCYLIRRLYNNLIIDCLTQMRTKLTKNALNCLISFIPVIHFNKVGNLSSIELNPNINQIYLDELETRSNQRVDIKYSTAYKCPHCGARKSNHKEICSFRISRLLGKSIYDLPNNISP